MKPDPTERELLRLAQDVDRGRVVNEPAKRSRTERSSGPVEHVEERHPLGCIDFVLAQRAVSGRGRHARWPRHGGRIRAATR